MMLSRRRSRIHLVRDVIQDHTSQLSSRSLAKIFNHQAQELLEVPNSVSKRSAVSSTFLSMYSSTSFGHFGQRQLYFARCCDLLAGFAVHNTFTLRFSQQLLHWQSSSCCCSCSACQLKIPLAVLPPIVLLYIFKVCYGWHNSICHILPIMLARKCILKNSAKRLPTCWSTE